MTWETTSSTQLSEVWLNLLEAAQGFGGDYCPGRNGKQKTVVVVVVVGDVFVEATAGPAQSGQQGFQQKRIVFLLLAGDV